MSGFHSNTSVAPDPVYEWRYEYYDDEEPVSFEGLKAHRYSIVIGFWVGLAVFVIFMFFVLTLLTKTGAPHPEGADSCEKRVGATSCMEELAPPASNTDHRACFSRPLLDTSRSLLHCYINEEQQGPGQRPGAGVGGAPQAGHAPGRLGSPEEAGGLGLEGVAVMGNRAERESELLAHFNIPNFVNSENSSSLGEDYLLLGGPPIILEGDCSPNRNRDVVD
ncbi:melanocortin-2 receptor accessory protein 2A [Osmerus mordax]|uniref:melanocortin-2 receptor accessory protein 2A n=1 Tax=Osmerus mordax TaxID=8014 RepID=UPI003510B425